MEPAAIPPVLFKFTEQRFADSMLNMGIFRIGTLHDFVAGTRMLSADTQNRVTKQMFKLGHGARVSLTNVRMTLREEHPDCFVYCLTDNAAARTAGHYDACIEIRQPVEFASRLRAAISGLGWRISQQGIGYCLYEGRDEDVNDAPRHHAFLKPEQYAFQREWRIVWPTAVKPIRPMNVICMPAAMLCRQVSVHMVGAHEAR